MLRRSPLITAFILAGLAWAGLALGAMAEERAMHRPVEAASLHDGPLDMVAYYQPEVGSIVVVATFAERDAPAHRPMRTVMALADGDDVSFAMPGFQQALYRFRREGATVTVSVREVATRQAVAGL